MRARNVRRSSSRASKSSARAERAASTSSKKGSNTERRTTASEATHEPMQGSKVPRSQGSKLAVLGVGRMDARVTALFKELHVDDGSRGKLAG